MKKIKKGVKITIIILALAAATAVGLVSAKKIIKNKSVSNETYTVTKEVYENVIEISGVVDAAKQQTLQAHSSGTVVEVNVVQGDTVKTGDIIMKLDDTNEVYNLARQDYEMDQVRITGSWKQLQLMQTQRKALVQKIEERKVTATFDGVIASITAAVGDSLDAKDSVGELVDLSYLTAEVEIMETDVAKLQVGQQVELKFPASSKTVYGYVTGWPAIGQVTGRGATVVTAQIRIDEYPPEILPNFSFSGKIKISPDEDFLIVSRYAVAREEGKAYVMKAGSSEKIDVKVMPYDKEYVKIVGGNIGEGDVLQGLVTPAKSGTNRNNGMPGMPGGNSSRNGNSGGMPMGAPPRGM